MLAETATTEISRVKDPRSLEHSREIARSGGSVAGVARKAVEEQTGRPVISNENHRDKVKKLKS